MNKSTVSLSPATRTRLENTAKNKGQTPAKMLDYIINDWINGEDWLLTKAPDRSRPEVNLDGLFLPVPEARTAPATAQVRDNLYQFPAPAPSVPAQNADRKSAQN